MNCGVPFCQSGMELEGVVYGCPLHNLIPEWNDMIWQGNGGHALSRLLKTNSFPEFTGRVCPALCETACVCGLHGQPVTIRENELQIIENGFAQGADAAPDPGGPVGQDRGRHRLRPGRAGGGGPSEPAGPYRHRLRAG